jgi:hypothetical protein
MATEVNFRVLGDAFAKKQENILLMPFLCLIIPAQRKSRRKNSYKFSLILLLHLG